MLSELLVPRRGIFFTPQEEGRFIPIASDVPDQLKQPLVRAVSGSIRGYESGYRSGLLKVDDQLYKLKGCRPEGGSHGKQPNGSQTLSIAQSEADVVLKVREAFLREGFEYPLEPIGFWAYDHILFNGEPNAATIYRAKGDTRLDEFLWWLERAPIEYISVEDRNHINDVLKRSGQVVGRALKVFHENGFCWDADPYATSFNTHLGNIVIFPDFKGSARFGIADFDNSLNYQPEGNPEDDTVLMTTIQATQESEVFRLIERMSDLRVISGAVLKQSDPHESRGLVYRLFQRTFPDLSIDNALKIANSLCDIFITGKAELPRKSLMMGFWDGYAYLEGSSSDEVSWNELTEIVRSVPRARRRFKREVMTAMEGEGITGMVIKCAYRLGAQFWTDPGLGNSLKNLILNPYKSENINKIIYGIKNEKYKVVI